MDLKEINNFKLPTKEEYKNLKIHQYVGFFSRKYFVFILTKNSNKQLLINYKEANEKFMLWISSIFEETSIEYRTLNLYKLKIESTNFNINKNMYINDLGNKLLNNYYENPCYFDEKSYITKPNIYLIKLEQFFIQNELPSCYLEELLKQNANQNILKCIEKVTEFQSDKLFTLKEYIDELFQFLFDKPKNILKINYLNLPILNEDKKEFYSIDQYACYFTRKSIVVISRLNKIHLISNEHANNDVISWLRSFLNKKDVIRLENYRHKIEYLSQTVINLGNELIENYDNLEVYTEKQQSLINLEQYLIRYQISTSFIYSVLDKDSQYLNNDAVEWIYKIIGNNIDQIHYLKQYLDVYFMHIFNKQTDLENNKDNEIKKFFFRKKKIYNKYEFI